jgi:hypothetical protein
MRLLGVSSVSELNAGHVYRLHISQFLVLNADDGLDKHQPSDEHPVRWRGSARRVEGRVQFQTLTNI